MDQNEALEQLSGMLCGAGPGRYRLSCSKGMLLVRLRGIRKNLRFDGRQRLGFRMNETYLIVEDLNSGAVRHKYSWDRIESITAGEPESDNAEIFQG